MEDTAAYWSAAARLDGLIDPIGPADRALPAIWARAAGKLSRVRDFLDFLGNPQDAYPIVHVTGTSGKGSTCAAIAGVLTRAGYRTGLATSPYLQVATEKLQVDGELIGAAEFAGLVDEMLAGASRWQAAALSEPPLSYGEIWVAMMLTWFARQRVDLAVIEVGAGGRFDVTNVVTPIVSVITSVGLDHTATLGSSIAQIAWHKAGIIKPGAPVVTGVTQPEALAAIEAEAGNAGVGLVRLDPARDVSVLRRGQDGTWWQLADDEPGQAVTYHSRQVGRYQAVNGALALQVTRVLNERGFVIGQAAVQTGLADARMPGRGERMPGSDTPPVVIDAAHNPDKVRALVASLPDLLPDDRAGKPVLVTGALAGKDARAMVAMLVPAVSGVVATAVGVTGKKPLRPETLAGLFRDAELAGPMRAEPDPDRALEIAFALAAERSVAVLVTGSLFLAGRVRERWYPGADILRQRTPWPATRTEDEPLR